MTTDYPDSAASVNIDAISYRALHGSPGVRTCNAG